MLVKYHNEPIIGKALEKIVHLREFELLFNVFYNSSAVEADKHATDKLWMNRVRTNHLPCNLCQCSNAGCSQVTHPTNTAKRLNYKKIAKTARNTNLLQ